MKMQDYSIFEIKGRIGRITPGNGMIALDIAANYSRKNEQTGEWSDDTYWNRVSVFSETLRRAVSEAKVGDRVKVKGRVRDSRYEKNGETIYTTDRNVREFEIVARAGERAD